MQRAHDLSESALLNEYTMLREEIRALNKAQRRIVEVCIAVIVSLAGIFGFIKTSISDGSIGSFLAMATIIASFLVLSLLFVYVTHYGSISLIIEYQRKILVPLFRDNSSIRNVMGWEDWLLTEKRATLGDRIKTLGTALSEIGFLGVTYVTLFCGGAYMAKTNLSSFAVSVFFLISLSLWSLGLLYSYFVFSSSVRK